MLRHSAYSSRQGVCEERYHACVLPTKNIVTHLCCQQTHVRRYVLQKRKCSCMFVKQNNEFMHVCWTPREYVHMYGLRFAKDRIHTCMLRAMTIFTHVCCAQWQYSRKLFVRKERIHACMVRAKNVFTHAWHAQDTYSHVYVAHNNRFNQLCCAQRMRAHNNVARKNLLTHECCAREHHKHEQTKFYVNR